MANKFALILAISVLVTGIIWCFERFKWAPARRVKIEALRAQTGGIVDEEILAKAAKQPSWVETGSSIFPVLLLVFIVRSFIYEPFQIPSGSMMPTLLIGDFILVEKYAYGIKDPITQTTLIPTGNPKHGDIAVFKYPLDTTLDYIKRVIGLPGDHVIYDPESKQVTVQPSCPSAQPCDKSLAVTYSDVQPSEFVQMFNRNGMNITSNGFSSIPVSDNVPQDGIRMSERKETLGNVTHRILTVSGLQDPVDRYYQQAGQRRAEWIVPAGHYFMMGDNRDNSGDSRFWGLVPEKNLVGKATTIWMSFEKQENEWPTGVRFSRIGSIH